MKPSLAAMLVHGQAKGAIRNGTRIVKVKDEPGDANPIGTQGKVLASHRVDGQLGYFVMWDTMPDIPVVVIDWKIKVLQ